MGKAEEIIAGMEPWFDADKRTKPPKDGRSLNESVQDSGIFIAAEFVRRYTGSEELSLEILKCCSWNRRRL